MNIYVSIFMSIFMEGVMENWRQIEPQGKPFMYNVERKRERESQDTCLLRDLQ